MHGDGMAMLVHPLRATTPSGASGLMGASFGADGSFCVTPQQTATTASGVPLSSLVADGAAPSEAEAEAADQSFVDFARDVWPQLGVAPGGVE
jgi:hypothetical protein